MGLDFSKTRAALSKPTSKHQHEFQEVCEELQQTYGRGVWIIPTLPYATEYKIREAAKIARKRGNTSLAYLIGIIKRLP